MALNKRRLAIAYYNDGNDNRNADVFVHIDGLAPIKEFERFAILQYGEGHGITDIDVYFLDDVQDCQGVIYKVGVKIR